MKPDVEQLLRVLMGKLLTEVAPALPNDYLRSDTEVAGLLISAAAEDYDRAAEVRAEENRAMRQIFRDATPEVPDAELRARLAVAAAEEDASLRVSALEASNSRLRKLLIELHALVEEQSEPWARRVDRAIWQELGASASRRAISFFPL